MSTINSVPQEVFEAFALQVEAFEQLKKGLYKVVTSSGDYALKPVAPSRERICFAVQVIQYLHNQGFTNAVPFLLTKTGAPLFITTGGSGYVVNPWLAAREANFNCQQDLILAASTMGKLHQAGRGFQPVPGEWKRDVLGSWAQVWQKALQELADFDTVYSVGEYLKQGAQALKLLENGAVYQLQVAKTRREGNCCHRDLVFHNLLVDQAGEMHIIDFEYCAVEMPVADVGRFLRKALPPLGWHWPTAKLVLTAYEKHNPLTTAELTLILAYLTFPFEFWRLLCKLRGQDIKQLLKGQFDDRYQSLIAAEQQRQAFLQEMTAEIEFIGR